MAIGDVFYEVKHFDDSPDSQFLAKIIVEDPAKYNISVDETGTLKFSPKPAPLVMPAAESVKYRLEKEGDLFRVWALQRIIEHGVFLGGRGGLVADSSVLSQKGNCWVAEGSKVLSGCVVSGDALVTGGSVLQGTCIVTGQARVIDSTLKGDISLNHTSSVVDSKLSTIGDGEISMVNQCSFDATVIEAREVLDFGGCHVSKGFIRRQHEVVSYWTGMYGWMSAYPNIHGEPTFAVGCQTRHGFDGIRELAKGYSYIRGHHEEMLDAFLALVEVAQRSWTPASKSGQDSEPVPAEKLHTAIAVQVTGQPGHIVDY